MTKSLVPLHGGFVIVAAIISGAAIPISTAAQNIGAGLLLLAFLFSLRPWTEFKQTCLQPFAMIGLALGLALLLGVFWTTASQAESWRFILKMRAFYLVPIFLLLFSAAKTRNSVLLSFAAAALLSVVVSCLAAWFNYPVFLAVPGDWFIFRTHTYHNYFAALLATGLLAGLLTGKFSGIWRWVALFTLVLISYDILFLVAGRTGQLIYLLMLGLIFSFWNWRLGLPLAGVITLAAMLILPNYSPAVQSGLHKAQSDLQAYTQGNSDTSVGLRLEWQKNSLKLIGEQPLFGHGTGSFTTELARILGSGKEVLFSDNPHNDYLWLSVELGVGGGILLLALLFAAAWQGRNLEPAWKWTLYAMLTGMGVSTLANSFFTDNITGLAFVLLTCALLNGPKKK